MEDINILVFPCGSEIGLELFRALKDIRFVNLYGASSVDDHGMWLYKNYIGGIPYVTDDGFISAINACIDKYDIDYVFPAMDSVILALSEKRDELHAGLLTSPAEAVRVCRSKSLTYQYLSECDFIPETYGSSEEVIEYPVLVKPSVGQGSQGVVKVMSQEQLRALLSSREDEQVICEYLPGREFTVDCFTDRNRDLRYVNARVRRRIKNGISVNSETIGHNDEISIIAEKINSILEFRGAWFFQVKEASDGKLKLLECATRVAGTMCVERGRGVNLPLLTIMDAMGLDVEIIPQGDSVVVDRALYNVFRTKIDYEEVYLDFDDTLIVHGRVNTTMLTFIYQCVERNIPVILLTRHKADIHEDLRKARICESLFADIIVVNDLKRKYDYVSKNSRALLIDDSFAERREMINALGIYALGVESVEALLDHRQ